MKSDVEVNEDQPRGDRQFVRARRTPIFLIAAARGQAGGEEITAEPGKASEVLQIGGWWLGDAGGRPAGGWAVPRD